MKYKYEYNCYEPYQYEDLQDHLEQMAVRGWILERMGYHFLVYRRGGTQLTRYALAYHPEVGDMDHPRAPRLEDYAYLCSQAGWELVGRWAKYPQIQVYASHRSDPVPLQTNLRTRWSVLEEWVERRYQPDADLKAVVWIIFLGFFLLYCTLLVFQGDLPPLSRWTAAHRRGGGQPSGRLHPRRRRPGPGGRRSRLSRGLTGLTLCWAAGEAVLGLLWVLDCSWFLAFGVLLWLLAMGGSAWLAGRLHSWLRERECAAALKWGVFNLLVVPAVLLLVLFFHRWFFGRLYL